MINCPKDCVNYKATFTGPPGTCGNYEPEKVKLAATELLIELQKSHQIIAQLWAIIQQVQSSVSNNITWPYLRQTERIAIIDKIVMTA